MTVLGRWLSWRRLRTRVTLVLAGSTLALGAVAVVHSVFSVTTILEDRLEDRGVAIAREIAARSAAPSAANDGLSLDDLVDEYVLWNNDVRYAFLMDLSGDSPAHTFQDTVPSDIAGANVPVSSERQSIRKLTTDEGPVLDIAVPVQDGQGGVVHVGMSEAGLREQVVTHVLQLSLMVGAAVLAAIALSYLVSSFLTRPLSQLADAFRGLGRGDFVGTVPAGTEDEVGDLARAFNTMTEDIASSRETLVQRNTELEILNSMAETLGREVATQKVLDSSLERLLELTRLSAAWVCVKGPGDRMRFAASRGALTPCSLGTEVQLEDGCPCVDVLKTSVGAESRGAPVCPLLSTRADSAETIHTHAIVPISLREGILGVLVVAYAEDQAFDENRMRLLTSIGQQIGIALENATLYEELERKERARAALLDRIIDTQEDERKRIAREIHDEPTQALSGIVMQLGEIEGRLTGHDESERAEVERTRHNVRATIESLQRITTELRPQSLDDLGFAPAVRWYAEQRLGKQDIDVDFHVEGLPDRLPSNIEVAVFRITQEAISNVSKHADAKNVDIHLEFGGQEIAGRIEDDGQGFEPATEGATSSNGSGFGLQGMRERAVLLGGALDVASTRGRGTTVTFKIPRSDGG